MNVEDRLPEALRESLSSVEPSPDLADRVVDRLGEPVGSAATGSMRLAWARVAVVALVAVVLIVGLRGQMILGPAAGSGSPGSPASSVGLAHYDRGGLAFNYPSSWALVPSDFVAHYGRPLAFLGTSSDLIAGRGLPTCNDITPGPSDQFIGSSECGWNIGVGPGQVLVTVGLSEGPPRPGPIDTADPSQLPLGGRYVTVGGLPATYAETTDGDTLTMSWMLSVPENLMSRFTIDAQIVGPGTETMRAQVEAMVASIRYDPPVVALDPADGPRIAALAVASLQKSDPDFACFPTEPGATATATVNELPFYSELGKPLPVTCSIAIEPTYIGLWKMTLTQSWTAASDRTAGSLETTVWVGPDGVPGQTGGGAAPDIPYWPVASPS
jgi:hypothetical protein